MILNTVSLSKYQKLISSLPSAKDDFIYFDCYENTMYFSNQKITLKIKVDLKEVDFPLLVVSKNELLHLMSFESEYKINKDYSYSSSKINGILQHNDAYDTYIDSLKSLFEDSYEGDCFTILKKDIPSIIRSSIFVSPEDKNPQSRCVHINENTIASSSEYRVYQNTFESNFNIIIPHDLIKFIALFDDECKLFSLENALLLKNNDVEVLLATFDNISYLSVTQENWKNLTENLLNSNFIKISSHKLQEALSFIKYYANDKPNKQVFIKYENDKLLFTIDSVSIDLDTSQIHGDFNFCFNSEHLANVIQHLTKKDDVITIYNNEDIKVFIVQLSETELVYLTKINA